MPDGLARKIEDVGLDLVVNNVFVSYESTREVRFCVSDFALDVISITYSRSYFRKIFAESQIVNV